MGAAAAGQFYQWSAVPGPARVAVSADLPAPQRLTDRLNAKLDELRSKGYQVQWIAAPVSDLTTLLREGRDEAIQLDPDPSLDVAWYDGVEIRPSAVPGVRVFLTGEFHELSCHIV